MTVDQSAIDAHRESVRALAKPGHALAPESPNATVNNPAWFRQRNGQLEARAVRVRLHDRLKAEYVAEQPDVLQERRAVVLAGPPGAGKSESKKAVYGARLADYLNIDADDFKRELMVAARADGSYEAWIVPDAVRQLEAGGERFFPLELASLVHEESSMLAKQLRSEAIERGDNVIIDTVLGSVTSALELGTQLEAAGYSVEVIDVEVPYEISEQRIATRWQESYEKALTKDGEELGGRWVPSEYARDVFDGESGRSRPEIAAERLASECAAVTRFRRFRTVLDGEGNTVGPNLERDLVRESKGGPLVPASTTLDAKAARARDFGQLQGKLRAAPSRAPSPPLRRSPGQTPRQPGKRPER